MRLSVVMNPRLAPIFVDEPSKAILAAVAIGQHVRRKHGFVRCIAEKFSLINSTEPLSIIFERRVNTTVTANRARQALIRAYPIAIPSFVTKGAVRNSV